MNAPSEEIHSNSTIYNFLLMVNSNRCHITYHLQDIFAYFTDSILIVDPKMVKW